VKPPDSNPWYAIFLQWVPMLLFIGVWIFFMRQMQGGGAKALSFGKARARLISEKQNKVTFQDVAGVDEAKEELREIIDFLKDPQKFQKLGGKIPKGVLLDGPPGRARPRAAPPGPLRPAGRRAAAGRQGARGDPARPRPAHPARAERRPEGPRARDARLLRRRPRQPRQRGGAARRAPEQEARRDGRLRERQGQGPDGRRATLDDHLGRREADDRVSRGGSH